MSLFNEGVNKMKVTSRFYVSALIVLVIGCSIPTTQPPADPRFVRGAVVNKDDPGGP